MLSELSDYALAWIVYIGGVTLFYLGICRLTRSWYRLPMTLLRGVFAVILFTPVVSGDYPGWWLPASFVAAYEWSLGEHLQALEALWNLTVASACMVFVLVLDYVLLGHKSTTRRVPVHS